MSWNKTSLRRSRWATVACLASLGCPGNGSDGAAPLVRLNPTSECIIIAGGFPPGFTALPGSGRYAAVVQLLPTAVFGLDLETEVKMLRVARSLESHLPVSVRTTFLGAHMIPEEFEGNRDGYVQEVVDHWLPVIKDAGLADAVDAFLESIAFTSAECDRIFETAGKLGFAVRLHADQLSDGGGARLAARHGALSADHLEWTSEEGAMAMADAGTVAVLLPGAYYSLGGGRHPPIESFRLHGVPMAVATDANPGSSPLSSLLLALNMACVLFHLTPVEALRGATVNAARALGQGEEIGTLEVGKRADLAVWNVDRPADLTYWVGLDRCRAVVKAGRTVRSTDS